MSALRSDFQATFLYEVSKLSEPWRSILTTLETATPNQIMESVGRTSIQVCGVCVHNNQCTFEKIAERLQNSEVAKLLYVMYGLSISCTTGEVHPYLNTYMRDTWIPWVLGVSVHGEPSFVYACRHSLKKIVGWMVGAMKQKSHWDPCKLTGLNDDTALHIAVRRRQWDWAKWLLSHGAPPYTKNQTGDTPLMLAAPHHLRVDMFRTDGDSVQWFDALHDALVAGKDDATWCVALIDRGADVNQAALYDAPIDSLIVMAVHGMDMNLGPLPESLSAEQRKLFYLYGRRPTEWKHVIGAFSDTDWILFLHRFFSESETKVPDVYIENVSRRQCITKDTRDVIRKLTLEHPSKS